MDVLIGIALTLLFFWNAFNTTFGFGVCKLLKEGAELTATGFEEVDANIMSLAERIAKLEERADKMGSGLNQLSVDMQGRRY
jgi:hypothetical protein